MINGKMLREQPSLGSTRNKLWFLLPSLCGIFLFMMPYPTEGGFTIPVAILASHFKSVLAPVMAELLLSLVVASALATAVFRWLIPNVQLPSFWNDLLRPTHFWSAVRVVGAALVLMVYFQLGSEAIYSSNTGGLLFGDLMPSLLAVFVFAGLFLPLLLNFGLLELMSTLLTPIMRPVFRLPGRSAIDCGASWLGDGSVGILMTSRQYDQGFYTQREAAIIGTSFSLVSISFTLVVLAQVKLEHLIFPFYATISVAGIIAAIVMARIPPLSRKSDSLVDGTEPRADRDHVPEGDTPLSYGFAQALVKVSTMDSPTQQIKQGLHNALEMVLGLLPVVMALGTAALIVAEYTPLFNWLGKPFIPLLQLLNIPEAVEASRTILVGFADMFLPAILAADISSDKTRFIIAALSVTQLIYMSEVGALLLGSRIPVNFFDMVIIFILRTLITLPVIALMAHWLL